MRINHVRLSIIEMPLKRPFITHLETVTSRRSIIVEAVDEEGVRGYGEVVAFSSPWYTEETVKTAFHMLKDFLIPQLLALPISHPSELEERFRFVRRNEMAKAGLETAVWDVFAKRAHQPLSRYIGGKRTTVESGAVVAAKELKEVFGQIEQAIDNGYKRVKVKISPENDIGLIRQIRERFPNLAIMADANSAYSLADLDKLKALDEYGLQMIEQPLGADDIVEHAILQKKLKTPICLDESITSLHDAKSAIELGSCRVMNLKIGRVGGWKNVLDIVELCSGNGVALWCGGMIEFGISRAHNVALASLEEVTLPGDIVGSTHYWEEDIILPAIEVKRGEVTVSSQTGIGYEMNERRLKEIEVYSETF